MSPETGTAEALELEEQSPLSEAVDYILRETRHIEPTERLHEAFELARAYACDRGQVAVDELLEAVGIALFREASKRVNEQYPEVSAGHREMKVKLDQIERRRQEMCRLLFGDLDRSLNDEELERDHREATSITAEFKVVSD